MNISSRLSQLINNPTLNQPNPLKSSKNIIGQLKNTKNKTGQQQEHSPEFFIFGFRKEEQRNKQGIKGTR